MRRGPGRGGVGGCALPRGEPRNQRPKRPAPVAHRVLLGLIRFPEALPHVVREKQRIVTEPSAAAGLLEDRPAAAALGRRDRAGSREYARTQRYRARRRSAGAPQQAPEQFRVVSLVEVPADGGGSGPPFGSNARSPPRANT